MEVAELTCVRNDKVRVNRRALEALLQQYQLALQQSASDCDDSDTDVPDELDALQDSSGTSAPPSSCDTDIAEVKAVSFSYEFLFLFCFCMLWYQVDSVSSVWWILVYVD